MWMYSLSLSAATLTFNSNNNSGTAAATESKFGKKKIERQEDNVGFNLHAKYNVRCNRVAVASVGGIANEVNVKWRANLFFCWIEVYTMYTSENSASHKSYRSESTKKVYGLCIRSSICGAKHSNIGITSSPKYDILFDIQMRLFWGILGDRACGPLLLKTVSSIQFHFEQCTHFGSSVSILKFCTKTHTHTQYNMKITNKFRR